jgi:hypothetical protein
MNESKCLQTILKLSLIWKGNQNMCGVEDNWIINIVSNNLVMVGGQLLLCLIIYCSSKIYSLLNGTKKNSMAMDYSYQCYSNKNYFTCHKINSSLQIQQFLLCTNDKYKTLKQLKVFFSVFYIHNILLICVILLNDLIINCRSVIYYYYT